MYIPFVLKESCCYSAYGSAKWKYEEKSLIFMCTWYEGWELLSCKRSVFLSQKNLSFTFPIRIS
jgi:hypothetical protein